MSHVAIDLIGLPTVKVAAGGEYNFAIFAFEPSDKGGAHHTIAGDKDALSLAIKNDRSVYP